MTHNGTSTPERIFKISAWLVAILTLLSFVLSYSALRAVAGDNGMTGWLSYVWPLIVDGALIIFAMAVLAANLTKERQWRLWTMVIFFTGATIYFNLVHASDVTFTARFVAVMPPVALFLSFETLMSMVRSNVRRQSVIQSMEELSQERQTIETEMQKARQQRDRLKTQLSQLEDKRTEKILSPTEKRRQQLPGLVNEGVTVADIADRFNVTPKTIYRDLKEIRVSLPTITPNGKGT